MKRLKGYNLKAPKYSHVVYHSVGNFILKKIKIEERVCLPLIVVSGFVFKRISKEFQMGSKSQI